MTEDAKPPSGNDDDHGAFAFAFWIAVLSQIILGSYIANNEGRYVFWEWLTVASFAGIGYTVGGFRAHFTNFDGKCGLNAEQLKSLPKLSSRQEAIFLSLSLSFVCLYLLGYYVGIRSLRPSGTELPVNYFVCLVTGITVSFIGFFAARYTAYIRMTKRLEAALEPQVRDEDVVKILRGYVFRNEQLFEPPGNIFVTVGITATFLGLAMGLIMLDLPSLFAGGNVAENASANGASGLADAVEPVTALDRQNAAASLRTFVACMGLALGMSMLGVATAMTAQWLRGHGAAETTDRLLARAGRPAPIPSPPPPPPPPAPVPPQPARARARAKPRKKPA